MSYEHLFTIHGSITNAADVGIKGYLTRPEALRTMSNVERQDKTAARIISECSQLIADLSDYRQALCKRYNALATMASRPGVEIQRYRGYRNEITYFVRQYTIYEDGTRVETTAEKFCGKDRSKAIARFEEIKRQNPGIESVKDIARKSWEK